MKIDTRKYSPSVRGTLATDKKLLSSTYGYRCYICINNEVKYNIMRNSSLHAKINWYVTLYVFERLKGKIQNPCSHFRYSARAIP